MPSPILHTMVGAAFARAQSEKPPWRLTLLSVFAANVPDLDLLPGMLAGDPGRFHHRQTHSLAFALALALLLSAPRWDKAAGERRWSGRLLFFLFLCLTHPVMDLLNDARPERALGLDVPGLQLFWPFSGRFVHELYPLFATGFMHGPWPTWFSGRNLEVFAGDLLLGGALFAAAAFLARRRAAAGEMVVSDPS